MLNITTEVWQRGPIENIPPLLQPVAHALLQAKEEVETIMHHFNEELLWQKPAGCASVGFHLQHLSGVLSRVFTYAKGEPLSNVQMQQLHDEDISPNSALNSAGLIKRFNKQIDDALQQLKLTDESTLTTYRGIGRKQLPSTVIGLLFHAAEHTMRHVGQLFVTVKVLQAQIIYQ